MRAEMRNVLHEPAREEAVPAGQVGLIHQPGKQQRAVRVGRERDRVEYNARCDPFLSSAGKATCKSPTYPLIQRGVLTLEASTHAPRAESVLRDIPHAVHHRVKYVVAPGPTKAQSPSANVVAERVAHQRRRERLEVFANERPLLVPLAAFDNLLRGPSAVFVDADHGEVWRDAFEHGVADRRGCALEQLLYDGVANVVARQLRSVKRPPSSRWTHLCTVLQ